ncbi:hypothetical protein AB0D54_29420 [Streptomyces xanthophaeus]|uniref:hypothetical protein n=1 Tax=Streptomyces xanthophaeus TaxID=67385 RepID=UPI0034285D4A
MTENTITGAVPVPEQASVEGAVRQDGAPTAETAAAAVPAPAAAPKGRRILFATLRWTAAVLVFAGAGAGVAYKLDQSERTDIPGLSTQSDGRWSYPELAKPELPAGAPLPAGTDNQDQTHFAALSALLLPAPEGAGPDDGFKADKDGVVTPDAFLEEYVPEARAAMKEGFEYEGLRQITGRAWTMPDGTRTRIYLLRFHSSGFGDLFPGCAADTKLAGAAVIGTDLDWSKAKGSQRNNLTDYIEVSDVSLYEEKKPHGDTQTRLGCLRAGDVQGVVIQSRKDGAPAVPFHQTVILQSQLLS